MVLHDSALNGFAMAIATSAGAFLAVSATIWIFLFDRRAQDESQALLQVRAAADAMYRFLVTNATLPGNYLRVLPEYPDLVRLISQMSAPYSAESIPRYLEWRGRIAAITTATRTMAATLRDVLEQAQAGTLTPAFYLDQRRFHSGFVALMFDLDLSIQDVDWAKGIRQSGVNWAEIVMGIAIFLVVASLGVALAAATETAHGWADVLNLYAASVLLINVVVLLTFLVYTFKVNSVSRSEWIRRQFRQKAKELGLPPLQDS